LLPNPLELQKAQVLFVEGRPPEVRLNDEATISVMVEVEDALQPRDAIGYKEIKNIAAFELELAASDAGHFTIVSWNDEWRLLFDFRRNSLSPVSAVSIASNCKFACSMIATTAAMPTLDNVVVVKRRRRRVSPSTVPAGRPAVTIRR
jgi:hypothetical protein